MPFSKWLRGYFKFIVLGLAGGVAVSLLIAAVVRTGGRTQVIGLDSSFAQPIGQVRTYADPARIRIPAIGVDAQVLPVGLTKEGNMGATRDQYTVAWYKSGPAPGNPGSAVMAGHLDTKLTPQAVFYDLNKLKPGDELEVEDAQGAVIKFRVVEAKIYPYDAPTADIFSGDPKSRLNLVTCAGVWMRDKHLYSERLVVFTEKE